jgi:hypothetical protein
MANISKALTEKELAEIETLAGLGLRFEDIALVKGMSSDTLKKYADDPLQRGRAKAKAQVMQTAYKMATSGKTPAMTMFWLKTRAGWREGQSDLPLTAQHSIILEALKTSDNPAQAVSLLLSHLIPQILTGGIDPSLASSISSLTNTLVKVSEQKELEARLEMLESLLKSQRSPTLGLNL